MSGYDLSAERSGKKSENVVPVISKRGKAELRYALYQAAFVASTRNIDFIDYYTKLLNGREREKGIRTKMRVKISAKMLVIAWAIMKKREPFNPDCRVQREAHDCPSRDRMPLRPCPGSLAENLNSHLLIL